MAGLSSRTCISVLGCTRATCAQEGLTHLPKSMWSFLLTPLVWEWDGKAGKRQSFQVAPCLYWGCPCFYLALRSLSEPGTLRHLVWRSKDLYVSDGSKISSLKPQAFRMRHKGSPIKLPKQFLLHPTSFPWETLHSKQIQYKQALSQIFKALKDLSFICSK